MESINFYVKLNFGRDDIYLSDPEIANLAAILTGDKKTISKPQLDALVSLVGLFKTGVSTQQVPDPSTLI